ncbi:membrane protein [Desulfosporosinus sp. HMP52]|uniref:SHOCT domain-containing protein n=1 Tax=Desulfosporosinus sp. HMP52 TaxID=1487923 RepID=UPI00051F8D21|nr:membrane protein [Desulfosporosinus sp. HMP52]KGK89118.1 membrane protein [Desulfosporosinus sp. HMP52]
MLGGWGSFFSDGFWGMGILRMAIQLLFWIVLIALIINLVRWIGSRVLTRRIVEQDKALDVLLGRYACGEIDLKEYQKRKKELLQ